MDFTRCGTGVATSYISYIYICVYLHTYKSTVVDGRTVERGYSSEHDRGKKASKKNAAKTRGAVTFSLYIAQSMTAKKKKKEKNSDAFRSLFGNTLVSVSDARFGRADTTYDRGT